MIAAWILGILTGWLVIVPFALLVAAVIARAEKPAEELAVAEPEEFYIPRSWSA